MKFLVLISLFIISFRTVSAAGAFQQETFLTENVKDSGIKEIIIADPKTGFKNLLEINNRTGGRQVKLNPQAVSFVQDYMDGHTANLSKMKIWGRPYFDMMDGILSKHGLPTTLKYLSVIESALQSYAVSWAGAVGPWQFMPATARNMGLRVNGAVDERTDFVKSTHAASRYLTNLYKQYGDWLLVIAAYNGGPGNVNAAIRKSGSRNFWNLQYYLPAESRNHVKKFIATHYIMEGEGGETTLTRSETTTLQTTKSNTSPSTEDGETMTISGRYNSLVIVQYIKMELTDFDRLNPAFDKSMSLNGTYDLRLPADKLLLFQANKPQILEQSIRMLLASAGSSVR